MAKIMQHKIFILLAAAGIALALASCTPAASVSTGEPGAAPPNSSDVQSNAPTQAPASRAKPAPESQITPAPQQAPATLPQTQQEPGNNASTFILLRGKDVSPDAKLNFIGSGFNPNEAITLSIDGRPVDFEPVNADKDGRINEVSINLPQDLVPGSHTLQVRGWDSGRSAQASFNLNRIPPKVDLDHNSLKPEQSFVFTGTGFIPNEAVEVRLGSLQGRLLGTYNADGQGKASGTVKVPMMDPGDFPVLFVGQKSQLPMSVGFNVQGYNPWVVLDNYSPPPYYEMGFDGEDFAVNEDILVYLNSRDSQPVASFKTGDSGKFSMKQAFQLPVVKGDNKLIFVGQRTGKVAEAAFSAQSFGPSLELSTYAGRPGSTVGLIGTGWARSETLHAYLGEGADRQEIATFQSGPDGSFRDNATGRIPIDVQPGSVPVTVVGDVSQVEVNVAYQVIELQPSAELTSYEGPAGTTVSFAGNGFAGGENVQIHLHDGSGQVLAKATADSDGAFTGVGSYTTQGNIGDLITFTMVGDDSSKEATTHFRITDSSQ